MAWCPHSQTLYFGCQNTSLQWFIFPVTTPELLSSAPFPLPEAYSSSGISTPPSRKAHKFFDSYPQYTRRPADLNARNPTCASCAPTLSTTPPSASSTGSRTPPDPCIQHDGFQPPVAIFQVPPENVIHSAHYGYVYCMALLPSHRDGSDDPPFKSDRGRQLQLVTGSGDSTVKVGKKPVSRVISMLIECDPSYGICLRMNRRTPLLVSCTRSTAALALCLRSSSVEIPCLPAAKMAWSRFGILRRVHLFARCSWWR